MRKKQRKEREKTEKEEASKSSSSDSDSKRVPPESSTQDDGESRKESGKVEETKEPGTSKAAKTGSSDNHGRRGKGSSNRQKTSEKSQAESGIREMLLTMLCFDLSTGVILMEARSMLLNCLCV